MIAKTLVLVAGAAAVNAYTLVRSPPVTPRLN
jgi:hypothetical protein